MNSAQRSRQTLTDEAFVFAYAPDHRRHCDPDGITRRYGKMTASLGLNTPTCTRCAATAPRNCLPLASTSAPLPGGSVTAAAERPRFGSMRHGWLPQTRPLLAY